MRISDTSHQDASHSPQMRAHTLTVSERLAPIPPQAFSRVSTEYLLTIWRHNHAVLLRASSPLVGTCIGLHGDNRKGVLDITQGAGEKPLAVFSQPLSRTTHEREQEICNLYYACSYATSFSRRATESRDQHGAILVFDVTNHVSSKASKSIVYGLEPASGVNPIQSVTGDSPKVRELLDNLEGSPPQWGKVKFGQSQYNERLKGEVTLSAIDPQFAQSLPPGADPYLLERLKAQYLLARVFDCFLGNKKSH